MTDNVVRLQHQGVFHVRVVDKLLHRREKHLHVFIDAQADAGRVDADIGHVVLLRQLSDGFRLGAEVHAAPLVALQNAKLITTHPALSPFCVPLAGS